MNGWNIAKTYIIDVESAKTEETIQQKLIEMGWTPPLDSVTRVEVIENGGRSLTRWLRNKESMYISMQDNNKTMKIFIEEDK
jgi:hypothetical protein